MIWIARRWRFPKVIYGFFIAEFVCTIPALVLFALADPDAYRKKLQFDGFKNGFNSNPKDGIYYYANHLTPPTPLVWSQFITTYNVVISVLSMFILLVKAVMLILHIWLPIISFLVHGGIAGIWAYSIYAQTSSDMSDPKNPQPGAPWYITNSCDVAYFKSNVKFCAQAKACLAIAVIMLFIFACNTLFAAVCVFPSAKEREDRLREKEEDAEDDESDLDDMEAGAKGTNHSDENSIELDQIAYNRRQNLSTTAVKSPAPYAVATEYHTTPRAMAFHRPGGARADLPLRH